jgi:hypothetical protein
MSKMHQFSSQNRYFYSVLCFSNFNQKRLSCFLLFYCVNALFLVRKKQSASFLKHFAFRFVVFAPVHIVRVFVIFGSHENRFAQFVMRNERRIVSLL